MPPKQLKEMAGSGLVLVTLMICWRRLLCVDGLMPDFIILNVI